MQLNTYLKLKENDLRDSLTLAMWNWWSMQSHIGHACGTAKHTDCKAGVGAIDIGGP